MCTSPYLCVHYSRTKTGANFFENHMTHTYQLTEEDMALCEQIELKRSSHLRKMGVDSKKQSDQDDFTIGKVGYAGEVAFSRITGLPLDQSIGEMLPYDFITPKGTTIDIKTAEGPYKGLAVAGHKITDQCDIYVLMVYYVPYDSQLPEVTLVGYAPASKVFRADNLRPNKKDGGSFHLVRRNELAEFKIKGR